MRRPRLVRSALIIAPWQMLPRRQTSSQNSVAKATQPPPFAIHQASPDMPSRRENAQHRDTRKFLATLIRIIIETEMLPQITLPNPRLPIEIGRFGLHNPVRQDANIVMPKLRLELPDKLRISIFR